MKSLHFDQYGGSEVLSIREVAEPEEEAGRVIVRVEAASVNPLDWRLMQADPFLVRLNFGFFKPKFHGLGADFSGVVEAVGEGVTGYEPGDAVFGIMTPGVVGSFAERISIPEEGLVGKPDAVSHEEAATLGVAALTAYEGIHDYHTISPGDRVLINGASGGIGTFAVQMAKVLGAQVTGVCSGRNHELVRGLGADALIDYTEVDITRMPERFDLVFDTIGNHPAKTMKVLLKEGGRLVLSSASSGLGFLKAILLAKKEKEPVDLIMDLKKDRTRLQAVLALVESGVVQPVIDEIFPFAEAARAIDYVATKRVRGKVVIRIGDAGETT